MKRLIDIMRPPRPWTSEPEARRRLADSGFTLVELLVALLILTLMTGMVVMGVTVGLQAYQKSSFLSESAVLEDTVNNALADPLHYMTYDSSNKVYTIIYRDDTQDGKISSTDPMFYTNAAGQLYLKDGTNVSATGLKILNGGAYTDCKIADVAYSFTPTTVSGSYNIVSTVNSSLTKHCTFTYKVLDATKVTS